jgi:hypothetical protein
MKCFVEKSCTIFESKAIHHSPSFNNFFGRRRCLENAHCFGISNYFDQQIMNAQELVIATIAAGPSKKLSKWKLFYYNILAN